MVAWPRLQKYSGGGHQTKPFTFVNEAQRKVISVPNSEFLRKIRI